MYKTFIVAAKPAFARKINENTLRQNVFSVFEVF